MDILPEYRWNNYTISNLFINSSAPENGLFRVVNGDETELKNIVFKNVNITTTSDSVGTLAGFVISAKTIENIQVTGKIVSGRENVGGLIGLLVANEVVIDNVTTTIDVTGDYEVGGLIGCRYGNSSITNSSAKGNVTATDGSVGGLLGFTVGGVLKTHMQLVI